MGGLGGGGGSDRLAAAIHGREARSMAAPSAVPQGRLRGGSGQGKGGGATRAGMPVLSRPRPRPVRPQGMRAHRQRDGHGQPHVRRDAVPDVGKQEDEGPQHGAHGGAGSALLQGGVGCPLAEGVA